MTFDGRTFSPAIDGRRLTTLLVRVKHLMSDGRWRTLSDIRVLIGGSEAGISARLRDLRKVKFGGYTVDKERVGPDGLWRYRLVLPGEEQGKFNFD